MGKLNKVDYDIYKVSAEEFIKRISTKEFKLLLETEKFDLYIYYHLLDLKSKMEDIEAYEYCQVITEYFKANLEPDTEETESNLN